MFPVLVSFEVPLVGPVLIQTYGVAAIAAFSVGMLVAQRRLVAAGIDSVHGYWAALFLVPAVALGAKVLPLIQNPFYREQLLALGDGPLGWLRVAFVLTLPGGSMLSAAVAGLGAALLYAWFYALPVLRCLDAVAPAAALAIPVMRLGCLGAGCCYGTATTLPWGVVYGNSAALPVTAVPLGVALHPAPLYEAAAVTLLALVLLRLPAARPGVIATTFVAGYAAIRFLTEFVRGDSPAGSGDAWLSVTQLVAAALVVGCAGFLLGRPRR